MGTFNGSFSLGFCVGLTAGCIAGAVSGSTGRAGINKSGAVVVEYVGAVPPPPPSVSCISEDQK